MRRSRWEGLDHGGSHQPAVDPQGRETEGADRSSGGMCALWFRRLGGGDSVEEGSEGPVSSPPDTSRLAD